MEHYPNYFENGTQVLTQEEKEDQVMFHHTNNRDIIYTGLNVSLVLAFLSHKKNKSVRPDSTIIMSSNSDIKKYNDAIKWGAKHAGQALPPCCASTLDTRQMDRQTDRQKCGPVHFTTTELTL